MNTSIVIIYIIIFIAIAVASPMILRLFELIIHKEVLEPLAKTPSEKEERKSAYKEFKKYIDQTIDHHKTMYPSCHFGFRQENELDENNFIGINEELAIFVYKILEKALSNILHHSLATHVIIYIKMSEPTKMIAINISDNGKGFDPSKTRLSQEFIDLQKAFKEIGGGIDIFSAPRQGTTINATLPLTKERIKK